MIQGLVAGTLAALNSIVAPLGSGHDDVASTFRFAVQNASPAATACMTRGQDPLVKIKLTPAGEFTVSVNMETRLCNSQNKVALQKTSFVLPLDVFDNAFLSTLVVDRPYILQAVEDPSHPEFKSRLKVTRLKSNPVANIATGALTPRVVNQNAGAAAGATSAANVSLVNNASIAANAPIAVQAFMIEWVPNSATEVPEHPPLTVWMKLDASSSSAAQRRLASASTAGNARKPSSVPGDGSYAGLMNEASLLTFPWQRFSYTMKKDEFVGLLKGAEPAPQARGSRGVGRSLGR